MTEARKRFEPLVEDDYVRRHQKRLDAIANNPKSTSTVLAALQKEIGELKKQYVVPKANKHLAVLAEALAKKVKEKQKAG